MSVVWQTAVLRMLCAAGLSGGLVVGRCDGVALRVGGRVLVLRLRLGVVLLMNHARGSRVLGMRLPLQMLVRCWTLLLMVGVMLHGDGSY